MAGPTPTPPTTTTTTTPATGGFWRYVAGVMAPASVIAVVLFLLVMGWLLVDALTAHQGPGEIPKLVGVVVLMPVAAVGSVLIGGVCGALVAPFRLDRRDPFRRSAFAISAAIVAGAVVVTAWALKDFWLGGSTG